LAHEGLISVPSSRPVDELVDRLEATLAARKITVFARIDHAEGAASEGMVLRPTVVLIFGHPRAGTPLMRAEQRLGLDLPLRMLAWEDADGASWLTYHDVAALVSAHGVDPAAHRAVAALSAMLSSVAGEVAGPV
jgi:uncharacterized protein (DUF302 family)